MGVCKVNECSATKLMGRGLCSKHYTRLLRHGSVNITKRNMHGGSRTSLYRIWHGIKQRTSNRLCPEYKWYGEKGVTFYKEWADDFSKFRGYVGDRPSPLHSIDRIDPTGNYEPDNVRWATIDVQAVNHGIRSNNTSGVTGVSWSKDRKMWVVSLWLDNELRVHQAYHGFDEALRARREAEKIYHAPLLSQR